MQDGLPVRDHSRCIHCGDCVKVCPVDAMVSKRVGWLARVGGKHGKHPYLSYEIANFLTDAQVCDLVGKTLEWYHETAQGRERIGVTIERVGLTRYFDEVVGPLGLEEIRDAKDRLKYYARGNFYGI
jgi:dissimilatory sulfite reductase (desulfoviridin) alpha/beta subunit